MTDRAPSKPKQKLIPKSLTDSDEVDWRPQTFPEVDWFTSHAAIRVTLAQFSERLRAYLARVGLKVEVTDELAEKMFRLVRQYIRIDLVLGSAKAIIGSKDWNRLNRIVRTTENASQDLVGKLRKLRQAEYPHSTRLVDYFLEELESINNELFWYKRLIPFNEHMKRVYQRDHVWSLLSYRLYVQAERRLPDLNKTKLELFVAACLVAGRIEIEETEEEGTRVVLKVHKNLYEVKNWLKEHRE